MTRVTFRGCLFKQLCTLVCLPGIVFNITGGSDLTLQEVNCISEVVTSLADPSCNIIFGAVVDERYEGTIHVTIIATGSWWGEGAGTK